MTNRKNMATTLAALHLSCLLLSPLVAADDQSADSETKAAAQLELAKGTEGSIGIVDRLRRRTCIQPLLNCLEMKKCAKDCCWPWHS